MLRRLTIKMMACFVVAIMSASSEAQLLYDFVESPSGDVLATLELTSLPATHAEVAGLTFTPAGEAIYGYAGLYSPMFDKCRGGFDVSPLLVTREGSISRKPVVTTECLV